MVGITFCIITTFGMIGIRQTKSCKGFLPLPISLLKTSRLFGILFRIRSPSMLRRSGTNSRTGGSTMDPKDLSENPTLPAANHPAVTGEFVCGFCLEITNGPFNPYPDKCEHCKVCRCTNCGTYLKHNPDFCYGCGTIKPQVKAHFNRTTNTSAFYSQELWTKRNITPQSETGEPFYLATSIAPDKPKHFLGQRSTETGRIEVVRALSDEEIALLVDKKVENSDPKS